MNNREKVIKDFESEIMNFTPACTSDELLKEVMETALELLKEQEPKFVLSIRKNHYERKGFCPKCHQVVEWYLNRAYCGFCGQGVKWDA